MRPPEDHPDDQPGQDGPPEQPGPDAGAFSDDTLPSGMTPRHCSPDNAPDQLERLGVLVAYLHDMLTEPDAPPMPSTPEDLRSVEQGLARIMGGAKWLRAGVARALEFGDNPSATVSHSIELACAIAADGRPGCRLERFVHDEAGTLPAGPLGPLLLCAITNACESISRVAGGTVRIDASLANTTLLIEIADDGPGLADSIDPSRLFEPGISSKGPGRGIGLSLCASITRMLGGVISLSPPGAGEGPWTTLRVRIPTDSLRSYASSGSNAA